MPLSRQVVSEMMYSGEAQKAIVAFWRNQGAEVGMCRYMGRVLPYVKRQDMKWPMVIDGAGYDIYNGVELPNMHILYTEGKGKDDA